MLARRLQLEFACSQQISHKLIFGTFIWSQLRFVFTQLRVLLKMAKNYHENILKRTMHQVLRNPFTFSGIWPHTLLFMMPKHNFHSRYSLLLGTHLDSATWKVRILLVNLFTVVQIAKIAPPKLPSQSYPNGPGNFGNLGCNKEVEPTLNAFSEFEFVLFNDTWSQKGHAVSRMTKLYSMIANHQIRHQATSKMGCLPGDCRSSP